jgi:5-methylcytosine-specific restriction endonuclease McrA
VDKRTDQKALEHLRLAMEHLGSALNIRDIRISENVLSEMMEICTDVEQNAVALKRIAERKRHDVRLENARYRTETEMVQFIAQQIEEKPVRIKKPPSKDLLPGGVRWAAMKNAKGKCEVCETDYHLTAHHIVPRDEGGLDEPDNIAILCSTCHDEIECLGYRSRAEIHRHVPARHIGIEPQAEPEAEAEPTDTAAKRAATREANQAHELIEAHVLEEWAGQWGNVIDRTVQYLPLGAPEPARPEKPWHVAVYGAGRHSSLARN